MNSFLREANKERKDQNLEMALFTFQGRVPGAPIIRNDFRWLKSKHGFCIELSCGLSTEDSRLKGNIKPTASECEYLPKMLYFVDSKYPLTFACLSHIIYCRWSWYNFLTSAPSPRRGLPESHLHLRMGPDTPASQFKHILLEMKITKPGCWKTII